MFEILPNSALVRVAAIAKARVSVPAPPSTVSVTRAVVEELENSVSATETLIISLPAPPEMLSAPRVAEFSLPSIVSIPAPPIIISFTLPPVRISAPAPALIVSEPRELAPATVKTSPASNVVPLIVNGVETAPFVPRVRVTSAPLI